MHGHFMLLQSITSSIASVIIAKQCFNFFHQIVGMERIELEVFQHIMSSELCLPLENMFSIIGNLFQTIFLFSRGNKEEV
jgi:hypothetical protein